MPIPPPPPRRPQAAGHVIVVVFVALVLGSLFNAQALTEAADQQPFGWKRTVAVVAVTPIRGIAGMLGLDAPRRMLAGVATALHRDTTAVAAVPRETARQQTVPQPAAATERRAPETEAATEPARVASVAGPTSRTATRRRPLRLWIGGDSMSSEFGPALADRAARTKKAEVEVDFRFSTGLSRPDYFNWPAHLRRIRDEMDPEVFVVVFGANDAQNLAVDGKVLAFGTPEWDAEYSRRIADVMDLLVAGGRTVLWIGQPVMRSPDFDARMAALNELYHAQARQRKGVSFIPTRELFSPDDGRYEPYLTDAEGQRVLMRQQDGVHLTRAGGERLAAVVFARLDRRWKLTG